MKFRKFLYPSALVIAISTLTFGLNNTVKAHDRIDHENKVHLYWQGNYDVSNYVDYTKTLSSDKKSIEWTVSFNSAQEKWVYPDFSVFLPTGVKAPTQITYEHHYWDGTVRSNTYENTRWHYDWGTQPKNFTQEFDKFPGYTGWSDSLYKFYALKNQGKFSRVLVDTYGREDHTYFSHKLVWKFTTELEEGYAEKWNDLPFLAGIKQKNPLAASFPSYKGEFGK